MERELTHISLFAGIGGIDIAAEWAGFRTVLFVEIDPFCQKVLRKHWPDVPILGDIRDVTKETIANTTSQRSHNQENKQELEGTRGSELHFEQSRVVRAERISAEAITPITLITGGFPCQPVSAAGQRRGKEDDRWLWPEMLRVVSEVRPTWVVAENVAGLLNMGFNDCVSNLESEGYETIPFLIPACGINAPHRRDRIFIVGYSSGERLQNRGRTQMGEYRGEKSQPQRPSSQPRRIQDVADSIIRTEGTTLGKGSDRGRSDSKQDDRHSLRDDIGNRSEAISDTPSNRSKARLSGQEQREEGESREPINNRKTDAITNQQRCERQGKGNGLRQSCQEEEVGRGNWWTVEPELGRVAYGIPNRVDRLKCLGNAVVPQQIYPILKAIADIERGFTYCAQM